MFKGMASPLLWFAGLNLLLFAAYGISKRIISPFGQLSLKETVATGAANHVRGDVQGADAGPVWESVGQAFTRRGEEDVSRVGVSEGYHTQLLGAFDFFSFLLSVWFVSDGQPATTNHRWPRPTAHNHQPHGPLTTTDHDDNSPRRQLTTTTTDHNND
jgi:hypothetical protein